MILNYKTMKSWSAASGDTVVRGVSESLLQNIQHQYRSGQMILQLSPWPGANMQSLGYLC